RSRPVNSCSRFRFRSRSARRCARIGRQESSGAIEACRRSVVRRRYGIHGHHGLRSGAIARTMTAMRHPRVLLADDHVLVLNAMAKFLAEECVIVGEVSDGLTVVAAVERLQPDIVLLDIGMPQVDGLTLARQIRTTSPAVKLVFLTMYEDPEMVVD